MSTTKALQLALTTALLAAAANTADAKPRRVVVLDLDGPRALADSSRSTIVTALGQTYDVVATKKWIDAKSQVGRKTRGPDAWIKASKQTGVDAVIEGYINEEGRAKVLTVLVTNATNGKPLDELTIRLGAKGFTEATQRELLEGLEERFEWIEPPAPSAGRQYDEYEAPKKPKVKDQRKLGSRRVDEETSTVEEPAVEDEQPKRKPKRERVREDEERTGDDDVTEKPRVASFEPKLSKDQKDTSVVRDALQLPEPEVEIFDPKKKWISRPTPVARFAGGLCYGSRSLSVGAEDAQGVDNLIGVPNKCFGLKGEFYPFPTKKRDGILSGVGFSFELEKSLGGSVAVLLEDSTVEFNINHYNFHGGLHYRVALSDSFALDGEVGYGQHHYNLLDPPEEFEVPDVGYQFLSAGGALDLAITDRSSVGFGAKYLYMLDTGNLNDTGDFVGYGPGTSWGMKLDAHFVIPLPKSLFVRGDINYTRVKSTFDGQGSTIVEDAQAYEASDSVVSGSVKLGIEF